MAAAAAAQQSAAAAASAGKGTTADEDDDEMPELEAAETAGPTDEADLDPKEIEMVMDQVCVTLFTVAPLCLLAVFRRDAPEREQLPYLRRAVVTSSMPVCIHLLPFSSPILIFGHFSLGSEWLVYGFFSFACFLPCCNATKTSNC
jgi:hypothetical protein